ncbi:spermine synthase [Herbiconiux sp.]|uniref:spermidine synthase n=1 Tax=Herbiconiux sp. TaxID=1871186 RepID=UPI0025B7CE09|nr:spermine synthase [Herbiconiux sp.]
MDDRLPGFSFALAHHGARLALVDDATLSYELRVDGIPQSRVCLTDPRRLAYPYVRQIARAVEAHAPAGQPLRCLHLGAGALTLPRYLAVSRPGSEQLVVEKERELCRAVLTALPLPPGNRIRMLYGEARRVLERTQRRSLLAAGLRADGTGRSSVTTSEKRAELVVVDLWEAARIDAHVASAEFYASVAAVTEPGGLVAVNLLDGGDFDYLRAQAATVAAVFAHVALVLDVSPRLPAPLGNALLFASDSPLAITATDGVLREADAPDAEGDPFVLHGDDLREWWGDARPMTDATATDSPALDDPRFA